MDDAALRPIVAIDWIACVAPSRQSGASSRIAAQEPAEHLAHQRSLGREAVHEPWRRGTRLHPPSTGWTAERISALG